MKRLSAARRIFWLLTSAVIVVVISLSLITGNLVKWLWMGQLGYKTIFWELLFIKLGGFTIAFALVFLYIWANLRLALRTGLRDVGRQDVLVIHNAGEITPRRGYPIYSFSPCERMNYICSGVEDGIHRLHKECVACGRFFNDDIF